MNNQDPIADMLTRIRNATIARHTRVDIPASTLKLEIARILELEGYIQSFKVVEPAADTGGSTQAGSRRSCRRRPSVFRFVRPART